MEVKLKLKVKDTEIELTKAEAEELFRILEALVGEKKTEYVPMYPYLPYRTWEINWREPVIYQTEYTAISDNVSMCMSVS